MSLFVDQKYLSLISNRLPLFKRKSDRTYNCRCVLCGDSMKSRSKARGYFFEYKGDLRYKCHNCNISMVFSNFLKTVDSGLHSQYLFEKYSEGKPLASTFTPVFEQPEFKDNKTKLIDHILQRLDTCPVDNEAVLFCQQRKIPQEKYKQLYYIENIKNIVQLNNRYAESIKGIEPRLAIPFFDETGQLTGVTCRALREEALRYITVKVKENVPLIFGLDAIDWTKQVFVVEGPLDSLFVDNCIAVAGTSFNKVNIFSEYQSKLVYIYDNQPRNSELCKIMEKSIDQGYNIVIWPQNIIEKDINDMILSNKKVQKIISENIYSGLTAKAKFYSWKRV